MNQALWIAKTGLDAQQTRMYVRCLEQSGERQYNGI